MTVKDNQDRNTIIIKYSLAGIFMNLFLAVAKLIIGLKIHSHSNLVIHNYGVDRLIGSADIEVDENMSAAEVIDI